MKGIRLGVELWVMDEGVAYPPLVTFGDPCRLNFGKPIPGVVKNLSSIIKAGTRIYKHGLGKGFENPRGHRTPGKA